MDTSKVIEEKKSEPAKPDYTSPIARTGEQQFACVLRNRSGVSSGDIDFGARFIDSLCPGDQQDAIEAAYSIYQKWCAETGRRSRRDSLPDKGEI